jgi:cytochrome c oxidase cbb3-type subunit I/II
MIRTLTGDVLRYGDYSKLGESIYDHPYQWGSKRTGPDLAREGGKYPNVWHYNHMLDPRTVSLGSTMPNYQWLFRDKLAVEPLVNKVAVQKKLGVPFRETTLSEIQESCAKQAQLIADDLRTAGVETPPDREIVAMISYLQKLGKSEPVNPSTPVPPGPVVNR